MARPTEAKDVKKDDKGGGNSGGGMNPIVLLAVGLVIALVSAGASSAAVFFIAPMVMPAAPVVAAAPGGHGADAHAGAAGTEGEGHAAEGGEHAEGAEHEAELGPIVDMEEFTVNLNDNHYLRADFSFMVSVEDDTYHTLAGEALEKWEEGFKHEMGHYIPALRDVIISSLTKRTSIELATFEGKEALKKEIQAASDGAFHKKHKVLQVNIENFIIQ